MRSYPTRVLACSVVLLPVVCCSQVVPSQGLTVQPDSSYTLRFAVADANHGLVDSVLMLPAGAIRLAPGPTAVTGGPYAVVSQVQLPLC
jgi:phage tail protein X